MAKAESKPPNRATLDAAAQAARECGVRVTLRHGDWVVVIDPPKVQGDDGLEVVDWG